MNEMRDGNRGRLQTFAGVAATAFAVTLAVVIGNRLSEQALAVLAGAVCGVGAAIPTSLLIVAVTRRRDEGQNLLRRGMAEQQPSRNAYPPVVVIAPPGGQRWLEGGMPPALEAPTQRQFTIVGGGTTREEPYSHPRR